MVAAIGFGIGGESLRRYRDYKQRRADSPYAERNAGFWTDRRILWTEAAIVFTALAPLAGMAALFTFPNFWKAALVVWVYAALSLLLLRGMNRVQGP